MLNSWSTWNRFISQDGKDLVTWKLFLSYNEKCDGERKLRTLSNKVGLEILKFPKNSFLVSSSFLICKDR